MEIKVFFPGDQKVYADLGGLIVKTDQTGEAPAPFALFLASIGTCAGVYVNGFCQNRGLPTEGLSITQRMHADPETHLVGAIELIINVPPSFPEKYHEALVRVANQCAVKKHLEHPPSFETTVSVTK
jgi:ribosomal protein S12 methylthiotransferase accessory factor